MVPNQSVGCLLTTLCLSGMGHIPVFSLKYPVIIALPLISIYVLVYDKEEVNIYDSTTT